MELKIPPLALVVIAAIAMWLAARVSPFAVGLPGRPVVALLFVIAGIAICATGVITFRLAKTTVDPRTPGKASALVDSGIYRLTRNPMYLGFVLALFGWAYWLSNLLAFIVIPVFILYMNRFQIGPEERALEGLFGEDYRRYCGNVRRWI